MELIVDVLIEVGSIVLMGCICFTVYVYGKIFLIKIGLIDKEQDDESIKDGTDWKLIGKIWKLNGKLIRGKWGSKYVKPRRKNC